MSYKMEESRKNSKKIIGTSFSTPKKAERFYNDKPGNFITLINKTPDAMQHFNNKSQYSYIVIGNFIIFVHFLEKNIKQ